MIKNGTSVLVFLLMLSTFSFSSLKAQSNPESTPMKIEVWSDVVCPFCFLGKKKLEQAIRKLNAGDQVEVSWHSFQLDPEFPSGESVPSMENLSERKGYPIGQVRQMCAQLTRQGETYGIDFEFEQALTFNTLDAHRLIQWASSLGKGSEVKEAFMQAYFSDGIDLSKKENLIGVVAGQGLDPEKARTVLESDAFREEVQQDIFRSRQLGVRGVPFFLVDGKEIISGAQPDPVFEQVIGGALEGR